MKKMTKLSIALLTLLLPTQFAQSQIVYVNVNATGSNDGTSWTNAYTDFQQGVDNATSGDSVFVAKGNYQLALDQSYSMKQGVKIFGGFQGTEASLSQRDLSLDSTYLIGNNAPVIQNISNNLTTSAVLDGFVITKGSAPMAVGGTGGGMWNSMVSPTIQNCAFIENKAFLGGGGISNQKSHVVIKNCLFVKNEAESASGGAIVNSESNAIIENCIFYSNSAANNGGAIHNQNSNVVAVNTLIYDNTSVNEGGAFYNYASGGNTINVKIINSTLVNNGTVGVFGFEVTSTSSTVNNHISNCIVWDSINGATYTNTYSLFKGKSSTLGNNIDATGITLDDIFVDAPSKDFSLVNNSIVVNVGSNDSVPSNLTTDLAGNTRVFASIVDLGAYENQTIPTIGINQSTTLSSIKMYPNPAQNFVAIEFGEVVTKGSVELINITGTVIQKIDFTNQDKMTFNLENLANGTYFIKIKSNDENKVMTEKIIKQ